MACRVRHLACALALFAWLLPGGCSTAPEDRASAPASSQEPAAPETPTREEAPSGPAQRSAEERGSPAPAPPSPPARVPPPAPAPSETGTSAPDREPAAGAAPERATTVDLDQLQERLRDTDAIGFFTKLKLKNELDDLVDAMRSHFAGNSNPDLEQLRERYDLLLMKVLAVLDEGDPALSRDLSASRDRLWDLLADPQRYVQS